MSSRREPQLARPPVGGTSSRSSRASPMNSSSPLVRVCSAQKPQLIQQAIAVMAGVHPAGVNGDPEQHLQQCSNIEAGHGPSGGPGPGRRASRSRPPREAIGVAVRLPLGVGAAQLATGSKRFRRLHPCSGLRWIVSTCTSGSSDEGVTSAPCLIGRVGRPLFRLWWRWRRRCG